MWWVWFVIGMFTGVFFGIIVFSLISASRDWQYPEYDPEDPR